MSYVIEGQINDFGEGPLALEQETFVDSAGSAQSASQRVMQAIMH